MDAEDLRKRMMTDPVARAKFVATTLEYMQSLGITVTDDHIKQLSDQAIKEAAESKKSVASTVAIITVL